MPSLYRCPGFQVSSMAGFPVAPMSLISYCFAGIFGISHAFCIYSILFITSKLHARRMLLYPLRVEVPFRSSLMAQLD